MPWGNVLSTNGSLAATLGVLNPFRYRGYVYDSETRLYYLLSRYYDPAMGRFINADAFASTGQGILGNNMFAYCLNNPINYTDSTGTFPWAAILSTLLPIIFSGGVSALVSWASGNSREIIIADFLEVVF